ncbi:uncharacterized protein LOC112170375 isoform X2 [Rosa chinensis]|uniref:uncharacterized protein LOC112170375 isoform X2 n=1 Tax=Rosa chinensis TaxID=74649 RepID=UPI001AD92FED|nr:uncharacterized protein LOC112170375 isoform X2 [Rosa chinensis]
MGLLGLVGFAFQRFHVLAWPLFALVYPLCSSIKAIETNSITDTHKINTYWVVFSLILLFENAFMKLLEWFLLWPYIRLLIVFFLVMPHFDGALYVYKHLICPCLSLDPQIVINLFNKRKESLARDNFLSEVERYVKENGPEGLEKFIACKSTRTNLNVKEFNAVSSMDNEASKSIKPNGGQNDIKAVQVSQAEPNLTVNEDKFSSRKMNEKAIGAAADREILNTPPPKKVQKEWTTVSPLPTQTDATFNSPLGDNKHKATYEALKIKNEAEPKLTWPESSTVAAMEIYEKPVEVGTVIEDPEPPKEVQKEWTCALCQVTTACERNMNSHLQGRKHKAAYEALKAGNQTFVPKIAPASTAKTSNQPNKEPGKSIRSTGKLNWPEIHTVSFMELFEKPVEFGTVIEDPEPPKEVQKEWTCALCHVTTACERNMNSHLQGRKHKAAYEALKAGNQAFVPKIAPASTAKTSNQPNKEPGKSIRSTGKLNWPEIHTVSFMELFEKPVEFGTVIEDPEPPKEVQKEWTCALCHVTTACERNMNSHLQGRKHKAAYEALKAGNQAFVPKIAPASTAKTSNQPNKEPGKSIRSTGKLNWPEIHTVSFMELFEKPVEFGTVIEDPEPPKVVQKEWTCALCQVATACERNMNSHLQGRKHKAAYEALKAGNQAFVPKIAPASTAKTSNQPNKEPGKSIPSSGSEQKVTVNENVQGQKNSSPPPITKKHYKPKEQLADGVSSNGQKGKIAIHIEKVQSQQPKPNEVPRVKSSPMRCKICGVCCSDEIDLLSHLNGKKHQENVQEYLIREWMKKPRGLCDTETGEFDIYW